MKERVMTGAAATAAATCGCARPDHGVAPSGCAGIALLPGKCPGWTPSGQKKLQHAGLAVCTTYRKGNRGVVCFLPRLALAATSSRPRIIRCL